MNFWRWLKKSDGEVVLTKKKPVVDGLFWTAAQADLKFKRRRASNLR